MRSSERYSRDTRSGAPRSRAVGWFVLGAVFLLLVGILLVTTTMESPPFTENWLIVSTVEIGMLLIIICGAIIAVGLLKLRKRRQSMRPARPSDGNDGRAGEGLFDDRLRRIEALHRDGVLTDGEYRRKRRQILDEKW
ncbi:MAG: hypothetical protein IH626_00475 [Rhodospirillales bacterium]|nr:hypothetical protein [Rhodospirillales bacterium]